jgi:polyketide biosynthesis enoyl-CoA hydratase PksH
MNTSSLDYETLHVEITDTICRVRFDRIEAGNTINAQMIREFDALLRICEGDSSSPVSILVLEGTKEVYCAGGDFEATAETSTPEDPEPLYDLWCRLATGPFVTISVVEGRANAGGMGFIAASDIVLAGNQATFSLSELLFGLFPACVLPFLIRRIGFQKANYLTLMTRPIGVEEATSWGLVDAAGDQVNTLLNQHLVRLRYLDKSAIARYKEYMAQGTEILKTQKPLALAANRDMFSDPEIQANIKRYVTELKFPWEP